MRHQTTFHHVVLLRCGIAAIAFAAVLGWGASSAAGVGVRSAGRVSAHAIVKTRSGTSKSAPELVIDHRIARDARMRLSDLPPGWVADKTVSRPTADAPCPGFRRAGGDISAGMASPAFSDPGDLHTAQSETYVYADTAMAEHWFAEFSSRRTRACLARLIRKEGAAAVRAEGFTLGPITARSIPAAPVGDEDAAFRVTVPFSGSGVTLNVDADVVFVRAGRGIAIFSLAALGSPFAPALETALVKTVAGRLATDLRNAP
jgi:hypothetical protein